MAVLVRDKCCQGASSQGPASLSARKPFSGGSPSFAQAKARLIQFWKCGVEGVWFKISRATAAKSQYVLVRAVRAKVQRERSTDGGLRLELKRRKPLLEIDMPKHATPFQTGVLSFLINEAVLQELWPFCSPTAASRRSYNCAAPGLPEKTNKQVNNSADVALQIPQP